MVIDTSSSNGSVVLPPRLGSPQLSSGPLSPTLVQLSWCSAGARASDASQRHSIARSNPH